MDDIRIGMIGCGGFAGVHARRLASIPGCKIVSLYDVNPDQLQLFSSTHFREDSKPDLHQTIEGLFDNSKLDAVVISSPHAYHFEQGSIALDRGCHVLMEKPMVVGAIEAKALAEKVRSSGKVFVVGYNTPCTLPIRRTREIVRSGELGDLEAVSGWLSQDWKRLTAGKWRQSKSISGGGQMLDSGAHLFASIVFCVDRFPISAYARVQHFGCEVEINGAATIVFDGGVLANVLIIGDSAVDGAGLAFFFEHGRVEVDGWGGNWMKVYRRGTDAVEEFVPEQRSTPDENFIAAIQKKEEPIAGVELGERLAILMDTIYQSAESNVPVTP
jgi:predicted dehydrogenase